MPITTRRAALGALGCLACAGLLPGLPSARASESTVPKTSMTPDQALARLLAGNARFVADNPMPAAIGSGRRHELAGGQGPFAAVVGCADSRTAPESLFGAGLGEVFTTRVAGNSMTAPTLASLAYSVQALGAPLVMVLGHERCGAVGAAVEFVTKGTRLPDPMMAMVDPIVPAVRAAQKLGGDLMEQSVRENARMVAKGMREHATFRALVPSKLRVVAARYDLDDGQVTVLEG
jgi:carbonic anhydrase